MTLPSTQDVFSPKQIEAMALAVYSPIPDNVIISSYVLGNVPAYFSSIVWAAFFKFLARL